MRTLEQVGPRGYRQQGKANDNRETQIS